MTTNVHELFFPEEPVTIAWSILLVLAGVSVLLILNAGDKKNTGAVVAARIPGDDLEQ